MTNICTRCALRLHRAAQNDVPLPAARRAFSHTTTRRKQHGIPKFAETASPELDDVLLSMREKHFVPAYLKRTERRLIFGTKHKQFLEDNPQVIDIAGEDVELKWIDRRTEIPNRTKLLHEALDLIFESDDHTAWAQLLHILIGMKRANALSKLEGRAFGKIVRKAGEAGRLGIVLRCLAQSELTGMTLRNRELLDQLVCGLHDVAQKSGWEKEAVQKALKEAHMVARLLETEEHGGGRYVEEDDARRRPEIIGVFLELAAVNAYKHYNGEDREGNVRIYANRLLSCLDQDLNSVSIPQKPAPKGPQYAILHAVPVWHGLHLADKILKDDMPQRQRARDVAKRYERGISGLISAIEKQNPREGSYGEQALRAWAECIRD
ncbi:hypothetical protein Tdes44962_MAKER08824 [Teratosphaeria destructans]|uniref:Uncharacterized protein n=1 Tax=Teratosphaeria destructans TaxID=418781 RepID=A0A9W7W3R1_9PEZI|nr:hypothetical protein Tdes44962_MAKER08824 [Teratosphaeria destructans]